MENLDFYELLEADQHDPQIQYQLGLCYLQGNGPEPNPEEAARWFQRAADQGHEGALALIAEAQPAPQPDLLSEDTLPLWCLRAEEGDADAQYAVASFFRSQDPAKYHRDIAYYLDMAVEQGHGAACMDRGRQLFQAREYGKAVTYLENAVECSIPEAAELLSYCYFNGLGVSQNVETAERLLTRYAQWGDCHAKLRLAVRYETGHNVPMSHARAMYYVGLAQQDGLGDAMTRFREQVAAKEEEAAAEEARLEQERQRQQQEQQLREAQEWEAQQARLAQERYEAQVAQAQAAAIAADLEKAQELLALAQLRNRLLSLPLKAIGLLGGLGLFFLAGLFDATFLTAVTLGILFALIFFLLSRIRKKIPKLDTAQLEQYISQALQGLDS